MKSEKKARQKDPTRRIRTWQKIRKQLPLHLMILPAVILVAIFSYGAMVGIVIAFEKYIPTKGFFGSQWVGLKNFRKLFSLPDTWQVIGNTVYIAGMKMIFGIIVPVVFSLLLNEVRNIHARRTVQTIVYLPNFLSWVILGGIFIDILSPSQGIVNRILGQVGLGPYFFLGTPKLFPNTMIVTDIWKTFGFGSVIYMASITGIDPTLYEAAKIDGANRWQQTLHVTLPGLLPTIILMATLSLSNVLNGGFDQIYNLYSPAVYSTGDILDTMVYRMGIVQAQYSVATAAGLFKSVISSFFIILSYWLADRFAGYRIF